MNPLWLDKLGTFGWREIVLLLAVLLALYVLIAYLRLRRIGRPPPAAEQAPLPMQAPVLVTEETPAASEPAPAMAPEVAKAPPPEPEPEELPWVRTPEQRDQQRRLEVIESEIVSMRGQIESLSETMALLVEQLRQEYEHEQHEHLHDPVEVAPAPLMPASPLYGDAMQLALAGHDAPSIAERCGIARAEAELVVALAQQDVDRGSDKINETGHGGGDDGGKGRY